MDAHNILKQKVKATFVGPVEPGASGIIAWDRDEQVIELNPASAGAETRTLLGPTKSGLKIRLDCTTFVASSTTTVTVYDSTATSSGTIVYTAAGQWAKLESFTNASGNYEWRIQALYGATTNITSATAFSTLTYAGLTGANVLGIPTAEADAFDIKDNNASPVTYLTINSTTASPTLKGGSYSATSVGGTASLTGGVGGATSGNGGVAAVAGGAGTNGNAVGGAATLTGGAGQGTANGGAATLAGGASGAGATGNGGAISSTGGAASSTNGVGGAASLVGGAGSGTGNGGAIAVTSGAGGATSGVSGAVVIASGTTAAAASGAVTIGSGNATGGIPGTTTVQAGAAQTAATAGGAIAVTGGAGNTSGNGGAITVTGGTPGVTGVGGNVVVVAGAGGATSGNGGASSVTGGAGTNGNGVGGAASLVGGAGNGSGAGGAITITSGAAGASGVAGTVTIGVGGATAGVGSVLTLNGGNGAGGTNGGGNINLVPGTAVSTGIPGEVTVNSIVGLSECGYVQQPPYATNIPVSGTSYRIFTASRAYRVKGGKIICTSAATTPAVAITKDPTGTAPGAGSAVISATTFSGSANTVVDMTANVTATVANKTLAAGDSLGMTWSGTVGSLTGAVVSVLLVPC